MATKKKFDKAKNDGYKGIEDGYNLLKNDIKSGQVPSVILLCGDERYLVQWFVNTIIKRFVNEATAALDFTRLDEKKFGLSNIVEACDTVSMLSEKRVVLVEDFFYAEGVKKKKKDEKNDDEPAAGFDSDEEMNALCDYLPTVPESTILIFTCGIPDSRSKFVKAVESTGKIYAMKKLKGADLRRFIEKRLKNAGKAARPEIYDEIIRLSGYADKDSSYTLLNLENDINKVIALSKTENISSADVASAISGNRENDVFKMLDAITTGRKDDAYRLMFNSLASDTGEGGTFGILALIIRNLEMILFVKEMRSEGMNLKECQANISAHPYQVEKAWGFSDNFNVKQLKAMCKTAYEIDGNVKKGLISDTLALEMFIANV